MGALSFRTEMAFDYGEPSELQPNVVRLVANNPSPFTFKGTNTYIVGTSTLAIIDPGPDDPDHLSAILSTVAGRDVSHILVTHTHRDHIDGLDALVEATGAKVCGYGRKGVPMDEVLLSPSGRSFIDVDFDPDIKLRTGDQLAGDGWAIEALHTPGHALDHLCFALEGTGAVFSGDHVMGWNTTVVAPPEGHMGNYLASLELLLARQDAVFFPGHGGRIADPRRTCRAYLIHRKMREQAILDAIRADVGTIDAIVAQIYEHLDPKLINAAKLSVQAHVEHLIERELVLAPQEIDFTTELRAS
ncbi:MAG: MBL fold metallo-hydrolase [Pseudomonadota bacterium]